MRRRYGNNGRIPVIDTAWNHVIIGVLGRGADCSGAAVLLTAGRLDMASPSSPKPTTPAGATAGPVSPDSSDSAQRTIASLEQELIACQHLVALGNIAAGIAHEVNNLMTPLLARAEFALASGSPAEMRKALERTKVQVERAVSITQRMMDWAHNRECQLESCNVLEAVNEALATVVRPLEKDGIALTVDVPPDLHVRARRDLLIQVVLNLILNARNAMVHTPGSLKVTGWRNGTDVVLEFCDGGSGLTQEQIDRVLNPFLAGTECRGREWQGIGLGLNVCRIIVHKCGARIAVRANETRGCTVALRWPAETPSGCADGA